MKIDPNSRFIATGSSFAVDAINIDPGYTIPSNADITGNAFDSPLYIPSFNIASITNNKHFQLIGINDPGPTTAQTIALNQIGTDGVFNNLRYAFINSFNVNQGVTVAIGANVRVRLYSGNSLIDKGTITAAAGSEITLDRTRNVTTTFDVAPGGTLNANGVTFDENHFDDYGSWAYIKVDPNSRFIANGSSFAVDAINFDSGYTIPSNADITNNAFDSPLYLPSIDVAFLANNKHFRDININDTILPAYRFLPLKPIGTDGVLTRLRYVFLNSFTVSPNSSVTVYPNVPVVINPNVAILDQGSINLTSGSTLTFAKVSNSTSSLEVASGGSLNANGGTIRFDSTPSNSTTWLQIDAGGRVNAFNSQFSTDTMNLATGSAGSLQSNTFTTTLSVNNASTVSLTGNNFANAPHIYANGSATGTVNLKNNYWGAADPNAVIVDHTDDATRPTANFSPVQANISAVATPTTITAQAATAVYNTSNQGVVLTASVTGSPAVNSGTVTFTIYIGPKVVGGRVTANVVNGVATANNYVLPGGAGGGIYGIEAIYNGNATYSGSIDFASNLTITGAPTSTVASSSLIGVAAGQSVPLSATVTSPNGLVNQGSVTFTVLNGTTAVGIAQKGTVVNGVASVSYPIPAGTAAQSYKIQAVYNATPSYLTSTDASLPAIFVSTSATTSAVAAPVGSFTFTKLASQTVSLTANVTSAGGTVSEGTAIFTILVGNQVVGSPVPVTVSGGQANATYTIPAGTPGSTYTVQVKYCGTANYGGSLDATQHVTINAAATTTAAVSVTGGIGLPVSLSATVLSPAGVVSEGTETFTIFNNGVQVGLPVSGAVVNGNATASFTIPSTLAAGNYIIQAVYNPTNNFNGSTDSSQTLTTVKGTATTNTVATVNATYNEAAQSVTLSTMLTSSAGGVNGGTVTFTILNAANAVIGTATTSGQVSNGYASVTYNLPPGVAAGNYSVKAVYSGVPAFLASTTTKSNALVMGKAAPTVAAANVTATSSPLDQTINLTANVQANGGNVNSGTLTFYIYSQDGTVLKLTSSTANVVNGAATVSLTLPAGFAAGTYIIKAKYTDPGGNYTDATDVSHTLIVS